MFDEWLADADYLDDWYLRPAIAAYRATLSSLDRDCYDELRWRMHLLTSDPPIDPDTGNYAVHSGMIVAPE